MSDYECIIVDDGSTDETRDICSQYDIKYIKIKHNGVSHARNTGVRHAAGRWLAFLDSDDEWLPEKLERQHRFITENPQYKIVHGNEIWIKNGQFKNQKKKHQKSGGNIFIPSLQLCLISPSAVVIEKDFFNRFGGFREDFPVCEDYDLWLKITAKNNVGFITDPLIKKYGGHDDQLSEKYKAMYYWRVKSIDHLIRTQDLTPDDKQATINELICKGDILLKGFKKYKRSDEYNEISKILEDYRT